MVAPGHGEEGAPGRSERPVSPAARHSPIGVYWVSATGIERHSVPDVTRLLAQEDGFVWVDIPIADEQARQVLTTVFGFHPLAVEDCFTPSPVPKLHAYADHVFVILHTPQDAGAGHVRYLEFIQFIGRRYLVSVHQDPEVSAPTAATIHQTRVVRERLEAGRFSAGSSFELSYAIVTALARHTESAVWTLARKVGVLERHVVGAKSAKPKETTATLEELFLVRHELLTVQTLATENRVVYARIGVLARFVPQEARPLIDDLVDQFDRVGAMCDVQSRFLQELLDYYQTRVGSELNEFVKRLTALGTMLVTATLIAGIYGMNFVHMPELGWRFGYPFSLALMLGCIAALGWWFRRKGWL